MNCLKEHKIGERRQDPADRRVILVELPAEIQEISRRMMRAAGATQVGPELLDGRGGPDVLKGLKLMGPVVYSLLEGARRRRKKRKYVEYKAQSLRLKNLVRPSDNSLVKAKLYKA